MQLKKLVELFIYYIESALYYLTLHLKRLVKLFIHYIEGALFYVIFGLFNNYDVFKYRHLWGISFVSKKKFYQYKKEIIDCNIQRMKKKKSIKIGILVYTGSMWTVDKLYQNFLHNERFDVDIIVAEFAMGANIQERKKVYEETKSFFINKKKYPVVTPEDMEWDMDIYSLLIYTTPFSFNNNKLNISNIKLKTLVCYVSYSYMLVMKLDKLSLPMYHLTWKFFCDSNFYKEMVENNSRVYTGNAVYCGYTKMDEFFDGRKVQKASKHTIIYAPHHSVSYKGQKSATFDLNYLMILELANKYKECVNWIVKPHPLLAVHCVDAGLFKCVDDYEKYLSCWEELPHSEVIRNEEYIGVFKASDGMITDSVSFMAEYQFTGNPLLLLDSGKQIYNDFGNKIRDVLYRCDGENYEFIENFIISVINGEDEMKDVRTKFFKNHLDYYSRNGKLANDLAYEMLSNSF